MSSTASLLRKSGLRATGPRLAILGCLQHQAIPVRVDTVWGKTRRQGIDRVTVYRTLEALEQAGVVRQVDLGHGHAHYEMNTRHHHHLVCESCGSVQDITFRATERLIRGLKQSHGFNVRTHSFEIFGLCAKCH